MKIVFRTNALRTRAEDASRAKRAWGAVVGQNYVDRVPVLMAVDTLEQLRLFRELRLHRLEGRRRGTWAISLSDAWRLIFEHDEATDTILILEVTDYHG